MNRFEKMVKGVPAKFNSVWLYLAVTVLFTAMILTGCQAQSELPAEMPDWVETFISENDAWMCAFERGLMYETPIVQEQEGVILTIWGVYVEPSATGVIYSVENYDDFGHIKIVAVDGEEVDSRQGAGGNYYAGDAGYEIVETITAASTGEHTLTVVLPQKGSLTSDITVDLQVNPDTFKDFYQIEELAYEDTANDVTLKINRVIYSPVEIWIEYSLSGETVKDACLDCLEKGDVNFIIDGDIVSAECVHNYFLHNKEEDNIRGVVLTRPQEITANTKIVFNKGSIYYHNADVGDKEGITFEDPWEINLPLPDEDDANPGNEIVQPYSSLQEAFDAVTAEQDQEYYFADAMFAYRSQAAYENKTPVYLVVLRNAKITDGMSAVKMFEVADEIIGHEETMLPITEDSLDKLKQQQTERIADCLDRTHEVVELVQVQERNLAEEAFSLVGGELVGYYNGDWYIVGFDTAIPQAAYNIETEELVVAEDSEGLNIVNGKPIEK